MRNHNKSTVFYSFLARFILTKTQVTRTTHEPLHNRTHELNTRPNHLAAIGGCATTVRATSHAWVGGRRSQHGKQGRSPTRPGAR